MNWKSPNILDDENPRPVYKSEIKANFEHNQSRILSFVLGLQLPAEEVINVRSKTSWSAMSRSVNKDAPSVQLLMTDGVRDSDWVAFFHVSHTKYVHELNTWTKCGRPANLR